MVSFYLRYVVLLLSSLLNEPNSVMHLDVALSSGMIRSNWLSQGF